MGSAALPIPSFSERALAIHWPYRAHVSGDLMKMTVMHVSGDLMKMTVMQFRGWCHRMTGHSKWRLSCRKGGVLEFFSWMLYSRDKALFWDQLQPVTVNSQALGLVRE